MFRQHDDLPNMLRVVRDLPVDGLQYGVGLSANRYGAHDVIRLERIDGTEHARPAVLPPFHDIRTCGRRCYLELAIPETVWLFAVASEEIRKAGAHISSQVLDQNGDRVCLRIKGKEEFVVLELRHCTFCHALVPTHLTACFLEIMSAYVTRHERPPRIGCSGCQEEPIDLRRREL